MSASTKASCFIGIHKAPPNLSRTEFKAKVNALGDAIAKLPVAQQNLLKLDIPQADLSEHPDRPAHEGPGAPGARAHPRDVRRVRGDLIFSVYFSALVDVNICAAEFRASRWDAERPALQKLLVDSDTFGFRKGATAFVAGVVTKVDAGAPTTVLGVLQCPPHLSPERFAQKIGELMDRIIAQPVRHCSLSYSLWTQNDAVELQALGYPMPEPLVIVEHSEVARLVAEGMREFSFHPDTANPAESCCFSADVSTKITNYKASGEGRSPIRGLNLFDMLYNFVLSVGRVIFARNLVVHLLLGAAEYLDHVGVDSRWAPWELILIVCYLSEGIGVLSLVVRRKFAPG
ncbi:hypothetical protein FB451DRAFT_1183229 [Mycena latifolia]|nr:hypothetical protein FB451DRAFT_1183229 [Mycena latifolia]